MKVAVLSTLLILISIITYAQLRKDKSSLNMPQVEPTQLIPFLTKQNDFIYVNKDNLKPFNGIKYNSASAYTSTGYAMVINNKGASVVIDTTGKEVLEVGESEIEIEVVNGLTFYKKQREYERKMPIWNWEWNILGGAIKKEQTYHSIEIGVIETKQILLHKEVPYLEDSYTLNPEAVDGEHIYWNETLYAIKNQYLKKKESDIITTLADKRFIKGSNNSFSIYDVQQKKAIHQSLEGVNTLTIKYSNEDLVLDQLMQERFEPIVPKLLKDTNTGSVYPYPQYDKAFPKEITKTTTEQVAFIKNATLVYSIHNSPYFLIGVFNYDHDIWAYDWLYLDINGQVLEQLDLDSFKVSDQIERLVWPAKEMVIPHQKVASVKYYTGSDELYLVNIEGKEGDSKYGVWDKKGQLWSIAPEYTSILALDIAKGIYALQKEKDENYTLYNQIKKENIGVKAYKYIYSDGLVRVKLEDKTVSYYIDIYTGRAYLEE
ncbi:hypothetical protein E0Z07_13380 [Myroides odoratimimus]|uniref:hypothetical protein n=1 Tax=Myroides odoratimimus TaxID=76832 RepID=UPI00103F579C|nr:hypothetical protein [Myroides odoratimimus]QBK77279.1 hypothetical protein E0Z07_13380 [Myroides odoratimimus]